MMIIISIKTQEGSMMQRDYVQRGEEINLNSNK